MPITFNFTDEAMDGPVKVGGGERVVCYGDALSAKSVDDCNEF
jgi:hypothetical protein